MKAILYAGAVLMTGASIYGFIDYKKSSKSISNLYETKQETIGQKETPVVVETKEASLKTKKAAAQTKPAVVVNSETDFTKPDKSPAVLVVKEDPALLEKATVKENTNRKETRVVKKRKVNHKMFSRGALDEKYIEKKEPKSETRKGTIKE